MTDYRKLIAFGKSSYVISLPKKWVEKHHLEKGSVIGVSATDKELVLYPEGSAENQEEKEIKISTQGKDTAQIRREIVSAYLDNCRTIVLQGKDLSLKATDIRDTLHNLMALEVMEQTSEKIIARDYMDVRTLDFPSLIRKADMIIRSMMQDILKGNSDIVDSLNHRDTDINRLNFLLHRGVRHGLLYPLSLSKQYSALELMDTHRRMADLERAADDTIRFAKSLAACKGEQKKTLTDLFIEVEEAFETTMKAVYTKDPSLAHKIAQIKKTLYDQCNKLLLQPGAQTNYASGLYQIKNIARSIHSIGRTVYV